MWFTKNPPAPSPSLSELTLLWDLVISQRAHIHQLQVSLARATNQPLPGPLLPLSKPPSLSLLAQEEARTRVTQSQGQSPSPRVRGAEAVTVNTKDRRREQELKEAVQAAIYPLPEYMTRQAPIPEAVTPPGRAVGGGFSPAPNGAPPETPPTPGNSSTGS